MRSVFRVKKRPLSGENCTRYREGKTGNRVRLTLISCEDSKFLKTLVPIYRTTVHDVSYQESLILTNYRAVREMFGNHCKVVGNNENWKTENMAIFIISTNPGGYIWRDIHKSRMGKQCLQNSSVF